MKTRAGRNAALAEHMMTAVCDGKRNIGGGTAARVGALGCTTMGDIARLSTINEDLLYKTLGVKAEIVIDHAWG